MRSALNCICASLPCGHFLSIDSIWGKFRRKSAAPITTVVLDADGTALDPSHKITEPVACAIRDARAAGLRVIVATGRARAGPWVGNVLEPMDLVAPGVFLQGLTAFDEQGTRIHDEFVEPEVVAAAEAACAGDDTLTLCAYVREILVSPVSNRATNRYCEYEEAQCELPEPWLDSSNERDSWCISEALSASHATRTAPGVSKLLVLHSRNAKDAVRLRRRLEVALDGRARVVQAVDWTLEILPPKSSKAAGVRVLLESLGVDPAEVMAVGDGENDLELLRMVGHPVAMGNAVDKLKRVARGNIVGSNAQDGVAQALREIAIPNSRSTADFFRALIERVEASNRGSSKL